MEPKSQFVKLFTIPEQPLEGLTGTLTADERSLSDTQRAILSSW